MYGFKNGDIVDGEGRKVTVPAPVIVDLLNERAARGASKTPINPPGPNAPEVLADDFGDPITLLNSRDWLTMAVEAKGARVTGGGCGMGQADIDIVLEGCKFNVCIRPR